ncbi:formylmethanofuran dehydrogenase subunit C [Lacipirellula limnantheis]|uniref:Formyltransferase/hydrolase complex Fhc subunit C n=1 Tax=Lacipirellula limnantheis TaxID=2528024 RepID=A0A517U471_9BACT|nr:formylmethanofuran dehydrogenase subunit C [Lacipirellula limnantheis]QDT75422.1 Formyltransferase/hydrolase complex Fhc subunit C [Lacipirellula limnantheis]
MTLRLINRVDDQIPIEMPGLTPGLLARLSLDEIRRMPVRRGSREVLLGDLFLVNGDPTDEEWMVAGDCRNVHGMGSGSGSGSIVVLGPIGPRAGFAMRGGRIEICGNAGDWLGAEMRGGVIRVRGTAGSHVGAATPGAKRGMAGGTILIDGNAGDEVGVRMRRGLIAVAGSAGANLGFRMLAGTILVFGSTGPHVGMGMRRGTIGVFGSPPPTLLPTFQSGYHGPLPMLRMLQPQLASESFAPEQLSQLATAVELFHGDTLQLGRGEVLLAQ